MAVHLCTVALLFAANFIGGFSTKNPNLLDNEVPVEYILTGTVMDDESAITALKREAMLTYQLKLSEYRNEVPKSSPDLQNNFDEKDFAIVGSLATIDASVVFAEGIKNLRVIATDRAAGFPGRPNPMNDQLHNRVQQLNAFRNLLWLLKEKLRSGIVSADAPFMDKLREAQTWLSTQTGGHLGQAVTKAFDGSGLMAKLEAKWGANSLKFRSFSAAAANGLDFVINGFNTVVNSIALNQEVTDANILALSSSVSAMAGDVTMGVTQILTTGAKASSAAGPIGYAVAATLYVASYATGVASGLVSQDNLQPKDYVKAFLSPLIPSPDFAAMVDMFDAAAKGDVGTAYMIYMTKSVPAALSLGGMAVIDRITGSSHLREHLQKLHTFSLVLRYHKYQEEENLFKQRMKENMGDFVRKLKPKQFRYAYPSLVTPNEYYPVGWQDSETLKTDFEIASDLTNLIVFMATYTSDFPKPKEYPAPLNPWDGMNFVPRIVNHGDDPFLFLGGNSMDDKVILDTNTEAYGMGGDDTFYVAPYYGSNKTGTVRIDGGEGSDTIYTIHAYEGSECFVTGGGPERDIIEGGKGNDFIVVENDTVSDTGGENTFLVTGSGDDTIEAGAGVGVIIINKISGSIDVRAMESFGNDAWKSRRIVYQGDALTSEGTLNPGKVKLSGCPAHHDVLSMTKYHPLSLSSNSLERMIVLLYDFTGYPLKYSTVNFYFDIIDDVADVLFDNTRCTRSTGIHPPVFCPEANESQHIFYSQIERFELSRNTVNLLLLTISATSQSHVTHEIIGGPFDDYVVNVEENLPLMAQMGAGANRLYSGNGNDSYSLILDENKDIIYDKGGHNLVAVMLPEGVSFRDVFIGQSNAGDSFFIYRGKWATKKVQLEYRFHDQGNRQHKVQFFFKESTGKEIVFKMLSRPSYLGRRFEHPVPTVAEFYWQFFDKEMSWIVKKFFVESATPAKQK